MPALFSRVGSVHPGRSAFDLSYDKKLTCDMGELVPIMCDEVVPGDLFKIANEIVVRFQPLVAPVLHEINAYVHYFFVPYRLLWPKVDTTGNNWEDFITGGKLGDNTAVLPRWIPSDAAHRAKYTPWDYFGMPVGVDPVGAYPLDFPRRAYNLVWNEYYRDETLDSLQPLDAERSVLYNRRWTKDYFTSALPFQQRGTAPALPISGTGRALWDPLAVTSADGPNALSVLETVGDNRIFAHTTNGRNNLLGALSANTVNFGDAVTFNVTDLRLVFQIQRWLERNARAGARYTEFLRAHYGVSPRDDRLQRPEYIGGSKSPVIVSEVLQTSATVTGQTAQGTMAGHGLIADANFVAKYHAQEFGLILGILSVMPKPAYQQGINRQWLRKTKYDFYSPEFANLSEQAIIEAEIYAQGTDVQNNAIFGYQGRYDEMRYKPSMVVADMRDTFAYWHLGRIFSSQPNLNASFVECIPRKDIFAVPSAKGLLINVNNRITAVRPLPIQPEPGLIDHV